MAQAGDSSARAFLQDLASTLKDLATLKVVTVVGEVTVTEDSGKVAVVPKDVASVEAASTEVNLLDAHILNVFSPKFSAAGDGKLAAFHQAQVEKSHQMVTENLAELRALAGDLLAMRR